MPSYWGLGFQHLNKSGARRSINCVSCSLPHPLSSTSECCLCGSHCIRQQGWGHTSKARLCSSHLSEEGGCFHKGSQGQCKWRECGGKWKREEISPREEREKKRWPVGMVTPGLRVGWMNKFAMWDCQRKSIPDRDYIYVNTWPSR